MSEEGWLIKVLKDLTESFGPAGFEREVAKKVKNYMSAYTDEFITDKLGSLLFIKKGLSDRPRVLLPGHIDEVGFVVSAIDDTGYISFNALGGWFDQVLLSQRVVIRTSKGDIHGVIAAKPPHLLSPEERKKVVERKNMFIDVGATKKEEAEELGIKIGDPITPYSEFILLRGGKVAMGKAFDDRLGAVIAMEVVRRLSTENIEHPNTVYGAATVQEEVGLRGATTVAHVVDPDVAIVLEVDIAGDVPGIKASEAPAKMGKGPAIVTYDASMIPNQPLKEFVIKVAEEENIPYQLSQVARGGTDAGRIHISRAGCPSIVIGVPTRHIHTAESIFSMDDLKNAVRLVIELIKRLDKETVESFTQL